MRLNPIYFRSRRQPQDVNKVPFKETHPLKLRNYVFGMDRKKSDDHCLFEMSLLFACWKKTEFDSSKCKDEMKKLGACYKNLMINMEKEKELRKKEIPAPGAKNLTEKQISHLLRKYPTV